MENQLKRFREDSKHMKRDLDKYIKERRKLMKIHAGKLKKFSFEKNFTKKEFLFT